MENKIIAIQAAIFAVCGNEMFEVMCDCHFTDEQHEGPCRIDRKEIHLGNLLKTIGIKDRTNGIGWYGIADDGSLLFLTEYAGKYDRGDVSLVGLTYDLSKSFDENLKNEKLVEFLYKIDGLYTRPGRGKPSLAFMHKSHFDLIPEFQRLKRPESDMEFRSLCSQKFAQAFYQANQ